MSAILQHITYNEFLPRVSSHNLTTAVLCSGNREKITNKVILQVIGWNYMNLYSLRVNTEGYTTDYDATCNPGIFNEFSTAAFRFGHSLIRPMLTRVSSNFKEMDSHIRLRDGFFNPDMLYESKMIDEVTILQLAFSLYFFEYFLCF